MFDPLSYKRTRHDIIQSVSSSRHPPPGKLSVVHHCKLVVACVIVGVLPWSSNTPVVKKCYLNSQTINLYIYTPPDA